MLDIGTDLADALYIDPRRRPADLFTFYFEGGVQRIADHIVDVVVGGQTYVASPAVVERGGWRRTSDASIDTLDVTLKPEVLTVGGVNGMQAARGGAFNGIRVVVERVFWNVETGAVAGTIVIADGTAEEVEVGTFELAFTIKTSLARLDEEVPKRRIGVSCPLTFGGTECGVTPATATRAVAAGSTARTLNLSASATTVVMVGGRVTFTSGALAGYVRYIREVVSPTQVKLDVALPTAPAPGAGITLRQSCDLSRSATTGCGKYTNIARFQGYPDTPSDDVMEAI